MKKMKLIIAIVLIVGGLVLGVFAVNNVFMARESFANFEANQQAYYDAELIGDEEEAAAQLRYASMN